MQQFLGQPLHAGIINTLRLLQIVGQLRRIELPRLGKPERRGHRHQRVQYHVLAVSLQNALARMLTSEFLYHIRQSGKIRHFRHIFFVSHIHGHGQRRRKHTDFSVRRKTFLDIRKNLFLLLQFCQIRRQVRQHPFFHIGVYGKPVQNKKIGTLTRHDFRVQLFHRVFSGDAALLVHAHLVFHIDVGMRPLIADDRLSQNIVLCQTVRRERLRRHGTDFGIVGEG